MRKAGNHRVSDNDSRTLVEFWKQIYDIDNSSDEIPFRKPGQVFLVNKKISRDKGAIIEASNKIRFSNRQNDSIRWIERLLERGLSDHREYVISIVLVPYFINIKHLSKEDATGRSGYQNLALVNHWTLRMTLTLKF